MKGIAVVHLFFEPCVLKSSP